MPTNIKYLKFFNKDGDLVDLDYNEKLNLLVGKIYLPSISAGLIENETLYIFQEVLHGGSIEYTSPLCINNRIEFSFKDKTYYKFFTVDNPYGEYPTIASQNQIVDYFDGKIKPIIKDGNGIEHTTVSEIDKNPYKVNIAFRSKIGGVFYDKLIIKIDGEIIAEIEINCECIEEDDRFVNKLADFGEYISENEEFIFRNSDISEQLPNYDLLNKKRKEFLIELHNIKPYFSSYKGIINILNLFDYQDLVLKEYWYDISAKKMFFEDINLYEEKQLENPLNYNPNRQKTTFFGLFYEITKVQEGKYNEDGTPLVKDNFLYSVDEIVLKLFGLKQWIEDREIGGVCNIIDIIGTFICFNKYNINFWLDECEILGTVDGVQPSFSQDKTITYIEDLRPYLQDWSLCELPRYDPLNPSCIIGMHDKCHVGWFGDSKYELENPVGHDEPNIPIGAFVTLTNTTFDLSWANCTTKWQSLSKESSDFNIKWSNAGNFEFYEMEWMITHENPKYSDFVLTKAGSLEDMKVVQFILPYSGKYRVTLTLHKFNNETCRITKHSIIDCKTKAADFLSYFKFINKELQYYKTCNLQWQNVNAHYGSEIYDNGKYTIDEDKIRYVTSTLNEYRQIHSFKDEFMRYKALMYESFENIQWKEYSFHSWNDLTFDNMNLPRFIIKKFLKGESLQINEEVFKIDEDINFNEYERLGDLLRNSKISINSELSNWYFIPRRHKKRRNYLECVGMYTKNDRDIIGCSENVEILGNLPLSKWEDFDNGKIDAWKNIPLSWGNSYSVFDVRSKDFAFTFENLRIYSDYFDCPILTPIFWTIDNSEMVGKSKCKWTLTNAKTNEEIVELDGMLYFCYTFIDEGQYSLRAEIEDSNGNKTVVQKEKIINVYSTNNFKALENAK